ncbi:MAG: hypothetical protein K2X86_12140 [Cytophagaceae bacterium]|nr:hypothetical protein [Cytophagaceae bacterium]
MRYWLILVIFLISNCVCGQKEYAVKGETIEMPSYKTDQKYSFVILNMGYASHIIQNPEIWNGENRRIVQVDVVFTAYPKNKEDWVTDYDWLLNKRIAAIQKLEPSLKNNSLIKWNFILQTACKNEEEAQRMFHGAIIKYISPQQRKKDSLAFKMDRLKAQPETDLQTINNNIESVVYGFAPFEDSVVFKVFNRNNWGKMVIVNDWTGSMYPYGAQAVLWHRMNFEKNAIKYFVFFNDGNQKLDRQKRIGNTGGIYYSKPDSIDYILKVMKLVAKRGNGGDIPENNIESLLKAIKLFKGYDELVMIADNNAAVKDLILLEKVTVPVRIILCGKASGQPVHPHYLEIARKTGGSVHTIQEDVVNLGNLKEGEKITISGYQYAIRKGKLIQLKTKQVSVH